MLTLRKGTSVARTQRVLSYAEEKFLDAKQKDIERDIRHGELQQGVNFEPKEIKNLQKRLDDLKTVKNRYGAVRLSGKEREQAEKEIKLIEARVAVKWGGRIPTYTEYWQRPKEGGIHFQNLVDKITELNSDREYQELIKRWKFLRRGLEPQNKRIDSVLHLFKH